MATKKKTKKKGSHPRKKKKVGAMGELSSFLIRTASVGAGAVAGAFVIQAGNTGLATSGMPTWAVPVGVAGAGAVLPLIMKKNEMALDFGLGMAAIGTAFAVNELGLSIPGIAGLAMSSNASAATNVMRKAVGRRVGCNKMGSGPTSYLNRTVGSRKTMSVGALYSN